MDNQLKSKREEEKPKNIPANENGEQETTAPEKPKGMTAIAAVSVDTNTIRRYVPVIIFGACIILLYIYNALHAEKIVRNTDKIKQEIKELRAEYLTIKSELELQSKQSQVTKKLEERQLKELRVPPFKITWDKKEDER